MAHSERRAMGGIGLRLKKTMEFARWYEALSDTHKVLIDARLDLAVQGHFVHSKALGGGLFEFKWAIGLRVYFTRRRIGDVDSIVLWGGFKDRQDADIVKARKLRTRYEN